MAEEKNLFELDTVVDKEKGVIAIQGGYEQTLALVNSILNAHPVFEILNDEDKKKAKELRADFNKCVKAVDRRRIDSIEDFTLEFTEQCNAIKGILDARRLEFDEKIKAYEDAQKIVVADNTVATKKYVATIKFTDEKLVKKLTDFCSKNNCELSIK